MPMTEKSFLGLSAHGFHNIVYFEWGDPKNDNVLVCVHGLTRRGRDFDVLARALESDYRVVCVDLPGRGESHWLPVAADYNPQTYVADMAALLARLDVEEVDWLGVSLGGLIGMILAAQPNTPIRKLVLDDVGPFISKAALERISAYVGADPVFGDIEGLEAYLREVSAPFGALTDAQWRFLAENSTRRGSTPGNFRLHYDPAIAVPFKEGFSEDFSMWPLWDMVSCPVLLLRGAVSDVLDKETAEEMLTRGPSAELIEFEGVGHVPALLDDVQIGPVRDWLQAPFG